MHLYAPPDTFEQIEVPSATLGVAAKFLQPGMELPVEFFEGELVSVVLPDVLEARVTSTAPPSHSQQDSAWKEATLENGLAIRVPLFIAPGETVRVLNAENAAIQAEDNHARDSTRSHGSSADANIIVGQSHFIKTAEDLYEAVATTVPQAKFGLAFNESSGACFTWSEGNDQTLRGIRRTQRPGIVTAPFV